MLFRSPQTPIYSYDPLKVIVRASTNNALGDHLVIASIKIGTITTPLTSCPVKGDSITNCEITVPPNLFIEQGTQEVYVILYIDRALGSATQSRVYAIKLEVQPYCPRSYTMFNYITTTATGKNAGSNELGTRFRPTVDGAIIGITYFKMPDRKSVV